MGVVRQRAPIGEFAPVSLGKREGGVVFRGVGGGNDSAEVIWEGKRTCLLGGGESLNLLAGGLGRASENGGRSNCIHGAVMVGHV